MQLSGHGPDKVRASVADPAEQGVNSMNLQRSPRAGSKA
jgi:hypothetical protein